MPRVMAGAALHNSFRLGQMEPTFSVMESRVSPLDKFTIISVNPNRPYRNGDEIDAVLKFGKHPDAREREKITEWLRARTGSEKLRLIAE